MPPPLYRAVAGEGAVADDQRRTPGAGDAAADAVRRAVAGEGAVADDERPLDKLLVAVYPEDVGSDGDAAAVAAVPAGVTGEGAVVDDQRPTSAGDAAAVAAIAVPIRNGQVLQSEGDAPVYTEDEHAVAAADGDQARPVNRRIVANRLRSGTAGARADVDSDGNRPAIERHQRGDRESGVERAVCATRCRAAPDNCHHVHSEHLHYERKGRIGLQKLLKLHRCRGCPIRKRQHRELDLSGRSPCADFNTSGVSKMEPPEPPLATGIRTPPPMDRRVRPCARARGTWWRARTPGDKRQCKRARPA